MRRPEFLQKAFALSLGLMFIAVGFAVSPVLMPADAAGQAANRMSATGSSVEILTAPLVEGASSEEVTLLTGQVKLASPKDLILRVTLECALWTDVTTVGDDASEAVATVTVWTEIAGTPVAVSPGDGADDASEVVFCNRAYRRTTTNFDANQTIETFISTRSANAFNWFALNPGGAGAVQDVAVKARLDVSVNGVGNAQAGIGKRTLIVEPADLGHAVEA